MPYNARQYDAAYDFLPRGDDNVVAPMDKRRIQVYNLYENLYINSTYQLKITLRGEDSVPLLMPSARKLIEATNRFLGVNLDYLVEGQGDAGTQQTLDDWFKDFFKREKIKAKFESSKRWGLVRGDAVLYLYADPNKAAGERISVAEIDPHQIFLIEDEDDPTKLLGCYFVEQVQDFRDESDVTKKIAKRRSYRKQQDGNGDFTGVITTDVTYWEIGAWDDRPGSGGELKAVPGGFTEAETALPQPISQLPIYMWTNQTFQNSSWGSSQLTGLETLIYGINQSLTDEDATIVFQGLGMYVTNAAPPIDPNTGQVTDWNIGPMQIIEIGADQTFERVSGVQDLQPFQDHMGFIADKGLSESAGIPEVAIGRVDVQAVESGISLKLQMMPLLAANAEKELEIITVLDQMFHDIATMWLPAYEHETFGDPATMAEMSVVCVFDDPMPVDRDAKIQETLLLQTSNLILTEMAVAELRTLGWKYPTTDDQGNALTDKDIAQMLSDQASSAAQAADPFAAQASNLGAFDSAAGISSPASNLGNTLPNNGANGNAPNGPQTIALPSA